MTVAVVIPCRNEARWVGAVLDALAAQSRRPDEIVVVDDGSTDGTAEVVHTWAGARPGMRCRVVKGPGRGPGPAMNVGIRATTASIIVRMDGHACPSTHYIEWAVRWFESGRTVPVGVVGGRWIVQPGADTAVARAIAAVVASPLGSGGARYRQRGATTGSMPVETVPFGVFPRTVWAAIDGYDEALAVNEDFDFNFRVRRSGRVVLFDPALCVDYAARPTLRLLARQYGRYGYWKAHMLRKHPRSLHPRQVPPALLVPWLVASLLWCALWPSAIGLIVAGVWPMLVLAGGIVVARDRRVNAAAASAALATVHVAWSLGFWIGAVSLLLRRR